MVDKLVNILDLTTTIAYFRYHIANLVDAKTPKYAKKGKECAMSDLTKFALLSAIFMVGCGQVAQNSSSSASETDNTDRSKYSQFTFNESSKSFKMTIPDVESVPSKYDDVDLGILWTREWLDKNDACLGQKVEDMDANNEVSIEWDETTEVISASMVVTGSCN